MVKLMKNRGRRGQNKGLQHMKAIAALALTLLLAVTFTLPQSFPVYAAAEQTAASATAETASLTRGQARDIIFAAASKYREGLKPTDIMSGYAGGSLKEAQPATRLETLVMISRAFGQLPKSGNDWLRATTDETYRDVPKWASDRFANLYAGRLLAPDEDGLLNGKETITATELDTLLRRIYALYGTRLQDDFYTTVNKKWLDNSDYGAGTFKKAQADADAQFDALLKELVSGKWEKGTSERKFADYYETLLYAETRSKVDITPLAPYLDAVSAAKNLKEVEAAIAKIGSELNFDPILYFYLRDDPKDGHKSAIELYVDINMNISGEEADSEAVIQCGEEMETLFALAGDKNPQASAKAALEMEYGITDACYESFANGADPGDTDRLTPADLQKMMPQADTKAFFINSGFREDSFVMSHILTEALPKIAAFYTDKKIEPLKALVRLRLITRFKETIGISGDDDGEIEINAMKQTAEKFPEYINYAYTKKYLSEEARADVSAIAADIMAYYKKRIASIGFMGDATKQAALTKLDVIRAQIGGPVASGEMIAMAEIKSISDGGSALSNMVAVLAAKKAIETKAQGKPRVTDAWPADESTHLVHAAFIPEINVFVVPAGILCPPFYEYGAPIEKNMAGIGWVMGHEITHAFDVRGSEYDATGQKSDWWTAEDKAAFATLNAAVIDYYDGYEAAPGVPVSGEQTLSENTADLGGAAAALSVLKARKANPDYKLFFTHSAEVQKITQSREGLIGMSENDDHAPYKVRANRVFSAFDEFYEAFGVKQGDGMYVAPEKRVKIW